jgi:hypothetical protein
MRRSLVLIAPLLLGAIGSPSAPRAPEVKRFRLELHVEDHHGIYFTAWADAAGNPSDVIADHDGADGKTVIYRRRFIWFDGCTWDGSEKLVPTSALHYTYEYREAPVSCPDGATADTGGTTPRDGEVTVHPLDRDAALTPAFAWAHDWDKPRS